MAETENSSVNRAPEAGVLPIVSSPDELEFTGTQEPTVRLLEDGFTYLSGQDLKQAILRVREARAKARPRDDESELVVLGTMMPDRRLSNADRGLDQLVLRSVRAHFHVGELPSRPSVPDPIAR